jgi:hypothetical protein
LTNGRDCSTIVARRPIFGRAKWGREMGDWYDFFEDFPEENPANWIDSLYVGPDGSRLHWEHQSRVDAARRKISTDQSRLDPTIAKIIAEGEARRKLNESR